MKIDIRVARALCRFQDGSFEPFLDYLRALRAEAMEMMVATNDTEGSIRQYQGRARAIGELLANIESAPQTLKKLES
jgi:hypothetical protein